MFDETVGVVTPRTFTTLTFNSNEHPLMKRFHKPGDEKRSVVIVRPSDYENWLSSNSTDEACSFLNLFPVELMHAEAFPAPPREPKNTTDAPKAQAAK